MPLSNLYTSKIKLWFKAFSHKTHNFRAAIRKKPRYQRFFIYSLLLTGFLILYVVAVDINFLWLFGKSPNIRDLNNPEYEITSELYSSDGKLLGKYFDVNRKPVTFEEISPLLIQTLIATEDIRFYRHRGIDIRSSFSVVWYMIRGKKRGASTITQQLVKNLFKTRTNYSRGLLGHVPGIRTLIYKTKEWDNALKIELFYTKQEILTMYLNTVDFGSNAFGIHTAARVYFNTTPDKLNQLQSATLVGMLKAPTYYSPVLNPNNSIKRRNVVLSQMVKYGWLPKEEYQKLSKKPLKLNYTPDSGKEGMANYFHEAVSKYLQDWLRENDYDLYRDGLKVYTTIDSRMQEYAKEAVNEHMKPLQRSFDQLYKNQDPWVDEKGKVIEGFIENIIGQESYYKKLITRYTDNSDTIEYFLNEKRKMRIFTWNGIKDTTMSFLDSVKHYKRFLHASFISMDPTTGHVLTWVGDINFDFFKYDHVKQARRQPGSTFKTFVYTAAIDNGYSPCDKLSDVPVVINYIEDGKPMEWAPHNVVGYFSGEPVTLKYGLARSINSIAVQLTKELGWQKVIEYAHKMGIESDLSDVPSVSIGSSDVSLYELVRAYCPVVNGGYRVTPVLVTRIEDKDGNIIKEYKPELKRVLSEETAFLMSQMLRGSLTEPRGTTQALFAYDLFRSRIEIGGKTGTSQNLSDGWFVGVSPKIIGGAWVGGEYRSIHFRSNSQGEGSKTALPIFGKFMEKVLKDKTFDYLKVGFTKPKFKITKDYSCRTVIPDTTTIPRDTTEIEYLDALSPRLSGGSQ
jgi:penicillin-binding protein 1A